VSETRQTKGKGKEKEKEKLRTQDTPEAWIKEGGFSCEQTPTVTPSPTWTGDLWGQVLPAAV